MWSQHRWWLKRHPGLWTCKRYSPLTEQTVPPGCHLVMGLAPDLLSFWGKIRRTL